VYERGKGKVLSADAVTQKYGYAKEGFYVYLRLEKARVEVLFQEDVIIRLRVSPRSWLHTSTCGQIATYRRIVEVEGVEKKRKK
jgi:hypothetical protein